MTYPHSPNFQFHSDCQETHFPKTAEFSQWVQNATQLAECQFQKNSRDAKTISVIQIAEIFGSHLSKLFNNWLVSLTHKQGIKKIKWKVPQTKSFGELQPSQTGTQPCESILTDIKY